MGEMAFPTLTVANGRKNDPKSVKDAQYLLKGNNRFNQKFYSGIVDGDYGPGTGAGAYLAKYWLGFPKDKLDHAFGPVLYSYLLPLTSGGAVKLPRLYRLRRVARLLLKKRIDSQRYRNPYRDVQNLRFAGFDQGVDYSGAGPVYALGPGRVTVATTHSGWPGGGALAYTLTAGPRAGWSVYFAENIRPTVYPGQTVDSGTVIAHMFDSYPYTESGWSVPGTVDPVAPLFPNPHSPKAQGFDFGDVLRSVGTPT